MTRGLPPDGELLAAIDEAAARADPGTVSWRDADGSCGTIARHGTFGNVVRRTRVRPAELARFLDDVARRYGMPPAFHVGPFETPGLATALLARGYYLAERDGILVHAMGPGSIPEAPGIEVREAREADDFLAESWLSGVVFGDPPMKREMAEEAARAVRRGAASTRTFLVPDPAGEMPCLASAGMAVSGSWAFFVNGQTHPAARGRGLYRALVAARLREASALGLAFAATEADAATSLPILLRWGFRQLGWKEIYRWPEPDGRVQGDAQASAKCRREDF